MYNIGKDISKLDTGIITTYALYFTIALLFFIFLIFSPVIFNLFSYDPNFNNSLIGEEEINIILRLVLILIFSVFFI
jgi:NADH-ubiquinone oxidoreductase chain 5